MSTKVILVTGGNRGIGKEIVRQLASAGHTLYLGSRNLEKGLTAAQEMGGSIKVLQLDVSKDSDVQNAAAEIRKEHGYLDVLINNAGIISANSKSFEADMQEAQKVMEANFLGPWRMSKVFFRLLEQSKAGRIVNMSSGMGEWDSLKMGGYAAYRLSKTSLNALTVQMAQEALPHGVKVNAMCPGWVQTDMGGSGANRPVAKGAETAVWLATTAEIPTGKFFRDKKIIPW